MRFVESSIKSCEKLLYYACKKGVPVMRSVRNSGFSLRVFFTRIYSSKNRILGLVLLKSFDVKSVIIRKEETLKIFFVLEKGSIIKGNFCEQCVAGRKGVLYIYCRCECLWSGGR